MVNVLAGGGFYFVQLYNTVAKNLLSYSIFEDTIEKFNGKTLHSLKKAPYLLEKSFSIHACWAKWKI